MKTCSLILAHPTPGSFNHAIAQTARARLQQRGFQVHYHDLYAEKFDPLAESAELPKEAPLPASIEQHCSEIGAADGIVIVHPNWWSQPPAILKGWLDRALRPGRAYNFVTTESGEGKPVGLLKAKAALVVTTANTPQEIEEKAFGDPLAILWQKVVFGLCGVSNFHRLVFSPVIVSTLEQRRQWLGDVETTVERVFANR
jgi:NAD(P)H dehydrogenase (quinone)